MQNEYENTSYSTNQAQASQAADQQQENPTITKNENTSSDVSEFHFLDVFKKPHVIIAIAISLILYLIGQTLDNEDARLLFSAPLASFTPIIIGITIIREAKKNKR